MKNPFICHCKNIIFALIILNAYYIKHFFTIINNNILDYLYNSSSFSLRIKSSFYISNINNTHDIIQCSYIYIIYIFNIILCYIYISGYIVYYIIIYVWKNSLVKPQNIIVYLLDLFSGTTGCCTYNFIIYDNRCKLTYVHAIEPSINHNITLVAITNTVF